MTDNMVPPREGQVRTDALSHVNDQWDTILSVYPELGAEDALDALAIASFRLDPPAFLQRSVK